MLLALPIFITSCSDDESGINSMIIGSWYHDNFGGNNERKIITFYDNGTFTVSMHGPHGNLIVDKGLYRLDMIELDGIEERGVIYTQSGDEWTDNDFLEVRNYRVHKDYALFFVTEEATVTSTYWKE